MLYCQWVFSEKNTGEELFMQYEIIDFHTHPFSAAENDICIYKAGGMEEPVEYLKGIGISRICGSVICRAKEGQSQWDAIQESNRQALLLQEQYGGFYIPGFHVHPDYVQQSCEEIERMHKRGVRLIGELVPYLHGWSDYSCSAFDEILDTAAQYGMVVNFHTMDNDQMDAMVKKHPNTVFVGAHPTENPGYLRHLERMKWSKNYYLDLSGTGLFRHRMLRYGIDAYGAERFLFGSDYPVCNPAMFIGGVALDSLLTEEEKQLILAGNAKRLMGL